MVTEFIRRQRKMGLNIQEKLRVMGVADLTKGGAYFKYFRGHQN